MTLNGEELAVPKTDFSLAEQILDVILEWNEEHPDKFYPGQRACAGVAFPDTGVVFP